MSNEQEPKDLENTVEEQENENLPKTKKPFYKKIWFWAIIIILIFVFKGCGDDKNNDKESFWNKEIYDNEDTQPQDITDDVLDDRNEESGNVGDGKYVEEKQNDSTSNETQQMTEMVQNEEYQVAYRGYTLGDAPYAELISTSPFVQYKDLLRYKDKYMNQWIKMNGHIEVLQNGLVCLEVPASEKGGTYLTRIAYLNCTNAEIIGNEEYSGLTYTNEVDCLDNVDCTILGVLTEDSDANNTFGIAVLYFIF